ncbi:hypothetical protein [Nonomuraea sp. KM90]|uniref:hypothetical protein n=1 Tax=Nonomuraea sp. KM90 TaxID=3457428 RepID=UPI003FCC4AF7
MPDPQRTGDDAIDAQLDLADALRQELAGQMATMQAEGVIRSARMEQLRAASQKAYRRIADFDQISRACIYEGGQIVGAGLDQLGDVLADLRTTWKAEREATAALARWPDTHQ